MRTMSLVSIWLIGFLLGLAGCQTFASPSTHVTMASDKAVSQVVLLDELLQHPDQYVDTYIEISGFDKGDLLRDACADWVGPPIEWALAIDPHASAMIG